MSFFLCTPSEVVGEQRGVSAGEKAFAELPLHTQVRFSPTKQCRGLSECDKKNGIHSRKPPSRSVLLKHLNPAPQFLTLTNGIFEPWEAANVTTQRLAKCRCSVEKSQSGINDPALSEALALAPPTVLGSVASVQMNEKAVFRLSSPSERGALKRGAQHCSHIS